MHRFPVHILVTMAVLLGITGTALAEVSPWDPNRDRGPVRPAFARPNSMNRVHDAGKLWMNFTNYGYFGNDGPRQSGALENPCPPGRWAPQAEFPGGSGQQYLFQGALWIGALIVEEDSSGGFETKRVSVGTDGWLNPSVNEFWPGEGAANGIIERSNRPGRTNCLGDFVTSPDAVSDQDFLAVYADTLTDDFYVENDFDGTIHRPLGIKISQTSYSFSQAFAEDFILIDYEIENVASNFLKNVYVGLYVDADCGPMSMNEQHTDDICGFLEYYYIDNTDGTRDSIPIDVAWIADNDGRAAGQAAGPLIIPHISGTRVIRAPNPRLRTSFNWWISNGDVGLDYGPSWEDYCRRDSMGLGWTRLFGTPMGDEHKYQVLSNGEFDFWQIMVDRMDQVLPQPVQIPPDTAIQFKSWCTDDPASNAQDIANGYDTRYLISWGPLGIYDYTDPSGRRVYRLNPGEKFNMTIAYLCGENFHDSNNPQPTDLTIDSSLFNFADLRENARWAKDVYDNRMFDTPQYDWGNDHDKDVIDEDGSQGDGILETGDGWYGEDVGADGLYIEAPPGFEEGVDSVEVVYFRGTRWEIRPGYYKGPNAGEQDGKMTDITNGLWSDEDHIIPERLEYDHPIYRTWDMGWMYNNGRLDLGDGLPDFTGPPPPPIPALLHCVRNTTNAAAHRGGQIMIPADGECFVGGLGYELHEDKVMLRWSKSSSENPDYRDPFSRQQDFEGYRIHFATVNEDGYYSLKGEFDKVDFAYFSETDSMMTYPVDQHTYDSLLAAGAECADFPGGVRGCLHAVGRNTGFAMLQMADDPLNDSTYEFAMEAHKLAPLYYSVTAFDYGDPRSGLGPLTTRPTTNAVLLAPAGTNKEPVRVVPNPYRAYEDYTRSYMGVGWENMNDGTDEFFSQQDRRLEFINLPERCLIRIFTVAGDVVAIIPHNMIGDHSSWASLASERWDLNSRNRQQVVSGIYLFSVEDMTEGNGHQIETGKFVIIR